MHQVKHASSITYQCTFAGSILCIVWLEHFNMGYEEESRFIVEEPPDDEIQRPPARKRSSCFGCLVAAPSTHYAPPAAAVSSSSSLPCLIPCREQRGRRRGAPAGARAGCKQQLAVSQRGWQPHRTLRSRAPRRVHSHQPLRDAPQRLM